jgi:hypothetical protein
MVFLLSLFPLAPRAARAEEAKLAWRGPACLDSEGAFETRLRALVKPADVARLHGSVTVTESAGDFSVQLSLLLGARALGERRFRARTCQAAAETAAVAAAMAAFSDDTASAPPADRRPASPPDRTEAWARKPDPTPEFSRQTERPAARTWPAQPRLGLLAFVQAGVLPSAAVGGALELGVGLGKRWSLALQGGVSGEQERALDGERSAFLREWYGAARGCVAPVAAPRVRWDACGGVQLLWIRGRGHGFDVDRTASLLSAAPLFALDLSWRVPDFVEWRIQAEGSAPLSRRRFLVDGSEADRAAPLTFSARLGPVVSF